MKASGSAPTSPSPTSPAGAPRSRRRGRRFVLRIVQLALVAATLYFLAAYLLRSWSTITAYAWSFDPKWLVLSAAAFLVFYLSQTVSWWYLLRGCGAPSPFWPAAATWAKSILARYVPGNVFMFVGRAWMSHAQGLPVERVSAAMVYEQAIGLCSALITVAVLFPFWEYRPGTTALSLIAIPVFVALMHPRLFGPLASRLLRLLHRPPLDVTVAFRSVVGLLAFFVLAWLVAGAGAWSLARAVTGIGVDALPLVVVAYAFAYVVGMAAFIFPSGIGVREAVLTASLSGHLPAGVVLAWAVLLRLWVTAMELAFVGLAVGVELLLRRRGREP